MSAKGRTRVAVLFGGKSAEHEVSIQSARNVVAALDRNRFEPVLIGIDKEGRWRVVSEERFLAMGDHAQFTSSGGEPGGVSVVPGARENQLIITDSRQSIGSIDVAFPVLHGPYGEDGSVQGLLKLANIPFVGAGVLGSAVAMDKDVMKRLLRFGGLPVGNFAAINRHDRGKLSFDALAAQFGIPFYIKPANLGSSVGISKVSSRADFDDAVELAFFYDRKIMIEENVPGREIECSVIGGDDPQASVPGEIEVNLPRHGFYSYKAKYLDDTGARLVIPADLPVQTVRAVQRMAVDAFKALCCEGMARVDFFLKNDNELLVNELNTIPGFTAISMYPKLWEAGGKSYSQLVTELIDLALGRFDQENRLGTALEVTEKI
jgi:D-alanine-D-alanine ligase